MEWYQKGVGPGVIKDPFAHNASGTVPPGSVLLLSHNAGADAPDDPKWAADDMRTTKAVQAQSWTIVGDHTIYHFDGYHPTEVADASQLYGTLYRFDSVGLTPSGNGIYSLPPVVVPSWSSQFNFFSHLGAWGPISSKYGPGFGATSSSSTIAASTPPDNVSVSGANSLLQFMGLIPSYNGPIPIVSGIDTPLAGTGNGGGTGGTGGRNGGGGGGSK